MRFTMMTRPLSFGISLLGIMLSGVSPTASAHIEYALTNQGAAVTGYSSHFAGMNALSPFGLQNALDNLISPNAPIPWWSNGDSSFIFGHADANQWLTLDLGQTRSINQIGATVSPYPGDRDVWDWIQISTSTDKQTWTNWGQIGLLDGKADITQADNFLTHAIFSDVRYISYNFGATSLDYNSDGSRVVRLYANNISAIPEPQTYTMLLAGLGLMGFAFRRRKQGTSA